MDLLKELAVKLRAENGVARLQAHVGKALEELSQVEADLWVDSLRAH